MKYLFLSFLISLNVSILAQISSGGLPPSFAFKTKSIGGIPLSKLNELDITALNKEDAQQNITNRYGIVQQLTIDIKQQGLKTEIPGKGSIWQYQLRGSNCFSIGFSFDKYNLPPGAALYIYDEDRIQLLGGYTAKNNRADGFLAVSELRGQSAILEYFEPENAPFSGQLQIGSIVQSYKDLQASTGKRIPINCADGANWQDDKHAVARMTYISGGYGMYCTGFLVNNTKQDGTPYFQTANHCISTSTEARTLITRFNYEYASCDSSQKKIDTLTISGASLIATSATTDFTLLKLDQTPPENYNPYFAGWDATGRSAKNAVGIHHPAGSPKCISTETGSPLTMKQTIMWEGSGSTGPNTHWAVSFNRGGTEGGSSGSPLFDENHRVIGQLHGGDNFTAFYGKQSISWASNYSKTAKLQPWLDPLNANTTSIDGTYIRIKPSADFSTKTPTTCLGNIVTFTDRSKNIPKQWRWKIWPATFSFANATTDTSQNIAINFLQARTYSVQLLVKNPYGSDSLTKTDYIVAGNTLNVKLLGLPADGTLCGCELDKYSLYVSGAETSVFSIQKKTKINYSTTPDSIYMSLKDEERKFGSFDTWLRVTGKQGTCVGKDSVLMRVIQPKNDDIETAIRLFPGRNASYFNQCATTQENEPKDLLQNFADTLLYNTVWFTFPSPAEGVFSVQSSGFAQKITLYKAETADDVFSENSSQMSIVQAANNANNPLQSAQLNGILAENGAKYWLQVDGFNGASGNFYIDLLCDDLMAFPSPASDKITVIIGNQNTGNAKISLTNTAGEELFSSSIGVQTTTNRYDIDVSNLAAGFYILKTDLNGNAKKIKIVIAR